MSKQIYFAGVSRMAGVLKFRTANNEDRLAQLGRLGDTDVEMISVNCEIKSTAAKELLSRNFANGRADIEALLVSVAADDNPFEKIRAGKTRVKKRSINVTVADLLKARVPAEPTVKKLTPKQSAQVRAEWNAAHAHLSYDGE